jgi:hypothetical protein
VRNAIHPLFAKLRKLVEKLEKLVGKLQKSNRVKKP